MKLKWNCTFSHVASFSVSTWGSFLLNFRRMTVKIPVSETIHPPDRCGTSGCWLSSLIGAQVRLRLVTIKVHSETCSLITQNMFWGSDTTRLCCCFYNLAVQLWTTCDHIRPSTPPHATSVRWMHVEKHQLKHTVTNVWGSIPDAHKVLYLLLQHVKYGVLRRGAAPGAPRCECEAGQRSERKTRTFPGAFIMCE